MPATRLTIALNTNQSQKAPLLVPASISLNPSTTPSAQSLVFKTAQSKLRLKKPARIFVGGTGQELLSEEDWKSNLKNDTVLLVSNGEEYVGIRREVVVHEDANPSCPVAVLANNAFVDELSVTQLTTTAHTLPGIIHAVGQPDLHPGTKFPIGAVFVSRKWIHPPLIGGDIGCGMSWYRTTLSRNQVDGEKGRKVAERLRGLEGAWRTKEERELWLEDEKGSCTAGEEWDQAVGTIGAGNHFAEIQVVEKRTPTPSIGNEGASQDAEYGFAENEVILLVHSGSRGYGSSILKKHTTDSFSSFSDDSPQAEAYMEEHDRACRWARANRDLIALRFFACLEPGEEVWQLGQCGSRSEDIGTIQASINVADITRAKQLLNERKAVDIWHNNVERVRWPPSPPPSSICANDVTGDFSCKDKNNEANSDDPREYVYIHRKGAAPTYNPSTRLPLSIIPLPGSRATPTIILRPSFSPSTSWGLRNGLSVAHGAGRSMSRAKALFALSQKYKGRNILEPRAGDADGSGTWVICDEKDLVFEEAPDAYKQVQDVAHDLVEAGAASVLGWCSPRVSYKVRNEGR